MFSQVATALSEHRDVVRTMTAERMFNAGGWNDSHHRRQPAGVTDNTGVDTVRNEERYSAERQRPGDDDDERGPQSTAAATAAAVTARRQLCHGCGRPITGRWLLNAVDRCWHEACLRCSFCRCALADVGTTLFARADLLLCRRDYARLFGTGGSCSYCEQTIAACEMVMRAKQHVYHLDCFACFRCRHRFCVGDRYYLLGGRILCEADYARHLEQVDAAAATAAAVVSRAQTTVSGASALLGHCANSSLHHQHLHHHQQQLDLSSSAAADVWYRQSQQHQLAAAAVALDDRKSFDDRSSGYGSPSPPSV